MSHQLLSLNACARVMVAVVCVSVTALVAIYLQSEAIYSFLCIVWTSMKMFCSGNRAPFACHVDRQLGSFSTKTHQYLLTRLQKA